MRKRSSRVTPAILGSLISLSLVACGEEPQEEAQVFETVAQCAASGEYTEAECTQYFNEAQAAAAEAAPRYEDVAACEEEFGPGKCQDAGSFDSGGHTIAHSFVPIAAGIMIGSAISQPLYRMYSNRSYGAYMTSRGYPVGTSTGRVRVDRGISTTRPMRSTSTVSRGGFGSMSRSSVSS
ncbi:MAG: DUF1190 domain-containing protein [Candidatus Sericytochromatia bacterium]